MPAVSALRRRVPALPGRLGALLLALALTAADAAAGPVDLYEQRQAYREALDALTAGRRADFQRARAALSDYVLAPYLDYYAVRTRLATLSDADMQAFQQAHGDLPAADILHYRWLKHLGSRREWQRLLDNFRPTGDAELNCYRLRAMLAGGRRDEAFAEVPALWTVGHSQPKACDPLFEAWIDAGGLTEGRAWERLQLALADGERRLARYLLRFFDGPLKRWADALYAVHVDPAQAARPGAFPEDGPQARVVIAHGLQRLAPRDPAAALAAWRRLQDTHAFPDDQTRAVGEALLLAAARSGEFPRPRPADVSPAFAEGMAQAALEAENWPELLHWVEQLPADSRQSLRWQYWLARALDRTQLGSERARLTYENLAAERNYYGFLAAENLGRPIRLNGAPGGQDPAVLARLSARPDLRRALELYAVGDLINARREWYALLPKLDAREHYHAALLARDAGWVAQSIHIANQGELRDSLDLRFPVAYADLFQQVSHATTVPKPFLLAVARQESAFDPRARSPVNARGLMQLMHPTASHVASRIGIGTPTTTDLYDPGVNVSLGGHHLAGLLSRYGNRRPLAAAAYNAGEGRVDRWIRARQGQSMDVWIETIPFGETRNYVKNVLAFTQVYGQLLDQPVPMLDAHESVVRP